MYETFQLRDLNISNSFNEIISKYLRRTQYTQRLNAKICEYCGAKNEKFEVHHIRNRKTMILCINCHK